MRPETIKQALWPILVAVAFAYVVVDFVEHPFLGLPSEAAAAPEPHATLWLAQTEADEGTAATVRGAADRMLLRGHPATVAVLPGGSSQAIVSFFARPESPEDVLAISSETVADLAQERASDLVGDDPQRAALAQRLLERALPIGLLSHDPLTIAVPRDSPIASVGQLLRELREAPRMHVFALTDGSWAADDLAALVQRAGPDGVVPYRTYPSGEEASLALAAGSADVVLAAQTELRSQLRAGALRALPWGGVPRPAPSWVALIAAPAASAAVRRGLERQMLASAHALGAGASPRLDGQTPASAPEPRLHGFLLEQMADATRLQRLTSHAALS